MPPPRYVRRFREDVSMMTVRTLAIAMASATLVSLVARTAQPMPVACHRRRRLGQHTSAGQPRRWAGPIARIERPLTAPQRARRAPGGRSGSGRRRNRPAGRSLAARCRLERRRADLPAADRLWKANALNWRVAR
jgi:hypothetical protein